MHGDCDAIGEWNSTGTPTTLNMLHAKETSEPNSVLLESIDHREMNIAILLGSAIRALLTDPDKLGMMAREGRRRAEQHFSSISLGQELESWLARIRTA